VGVGSWRASGGEGGLLGLAVGLDPELAAAALPWRWRTARPAAGVVLRAVSRSSGHFIEEALRSGARGNGGEAARAGATCRRASASGRGADSAESRGALACVPASGGCAA
jgi:hypothetical protein